jgi:uncharacterized protein (DUF952 family)
MQDLFIYHIVTLPEWEAQKNYLHYIAPSIAKEGFIHCSTMDQLAATIKRYYGNEEQVVVLKIEVAALEYELSYDLSMSVNQLFPHIYGPLNTDAIVQAETVRV